MNGRRGGGELDLGTWPEFDSSALPLAHRKVFVARRCALELYAQRVALEQIKVETGVDRRQLQPQRPDSTPSATTTSSLCGTG